MSRKDIRFVVLGVLGTTALLAVSRSSLAQIVRVGGGGVHVRAPFVRVDVFPGGGVSVRAPFAAIDTPGRMYYYEPAPVIIEERASQPVFPTASELAAMDDAQLAQLQRWISERLNRRLARFNTGATWQRHLRLSPEVTDYSIDPELRRAALVKALDRYQSIASDPQYEKISRLPEFAATQVALSESVARLDGTQTEVDPGVEELPLPAPEQPPQPDLDRPFFQPKQR